MMIGMRKAYIAAALAILIIVLALAFGGRKGTENKKETAPLLVHSNDGLATLAIPPENLPAGVDLRDIKISSLDPAAAPVKLTDGELLAGFSFEPAGLTFGGPADATLEVANLGNKMPLILHISKSGAELVHSLSVGKNENGKTVVKFPIDHFSEHYVFTKGTDVEMEILTRAFVGDQIKFVTTVKRHPWRSVVTYEFEGEKHTILQVVVGGWTIRGFASARSYIGTELGKVILEPAKISDLPPRTVLPKELEQFTIPSPPFRCKNEGWAQITHYLHLDLDTEETKFDADGNEEGRREGSVDVDLDNTVHRVECDPLPDEIAVFEKGGKLYPASQFRVSNYLGTCDAGGGYGYITRSKKALSLDLTIWEDPDPTGCHFVPYGSMETKKIKVSRDELKDFYRALENLENK